MSTIVTCLGRPSKLDIPSVDAISAESVSVSWKCVESTDNSPLSYIVQHKSKESTVWLSERAVDMPPIIVDGLKDGVAYVFRVAAQNEHGIGEFSDESNPFFVSGKYAAYIVRDRL